MGQQRSPDQAPPQPQPDLALRRSESVLFVIRYCAETINTLNDALCGFYQSHCPRRRSGGVGGGDEAGGEGESAGGGGGPGSEEDESVVCPAHEQEGEVCANTREDCTGIVERGGCASLREASECVQACTQCCGDAHPGCRPWAFSGALPTPTPQPLLYSFNPPLCTSP